MEAKTTITLTPELLNRIEELKPYDEEYGSVVCNLFAVVENQFAALYGRLVKTQASNEQKSEIFNLLWQTQDVIRVIKNKTDDIDIFSKVEILILDIKEQVKQE